MPRTSAPESIVGQLWRHRLWIVPGVVFAVIAVVVATYSVRLSPPSLTRDSAEYAAASTQVLVDYPLKSSIADLNLELTPLVDRANVYARLGPTPEILQMIGKRSGITPSLIDAKGPYNPGGERELREPSLERRSTQIKAERDSYRLRFDAEHDQQVPIVNIYSQAPTTLEANKLADAAASSLSDYIKGVQKDQNLKDYEAVTLRPLGHADGGVVNPGVDRQIAMLTFVSTLAGWAMVVLLTSNLVRYLRSRSNRSTEAPAAVPVDWELMIDDRLEPPTAGSHP